MSRLDADNEARARRIMARYPRPRSALIPLLHLAQAQDGYVTSEAMRHIAELIGITPAEVAGTATFYEMFKFHPVGRYLVNVCTNISCWLMGADDLVAHAGATLGVSPGGTTADGMFTLETVECMAACTEAPCLAVNYRYRLRVTPEDFDRLVAAIRAGETAEEIPLHGSLARVDQSIPEDRMAGVVPPEAARAAPVWLAARGSDLQGES